MSRVTITNLVKSFGSFQAVKGVSLDIAEGELVTLLGSSGCGKTTTLRCVAGLETADSGDISFDGRSMRGVAAPERSCGMVFQNYALFPHMTVEENLAYGLMAERWRRSSLPARLGLLATSPVRAVDDDGRKRIEEALAMIEMTEYRRRRPGELSGGQQQRVALARAMITRPRVLLFDEPLGALDARLRIKMREEIRLMQRRAGITTLYVTHDQEEALAISDRIAVMRGGRIEQLDTPEIVYKRPRTRFVADFLGLENVFSADADASGRVRLEASPLALATATPPPRDRFTVAIRPEALRFLAQDATAENVIEGVVSLRMFLGATVKHVVTVAGTEIVVRSGGATDVDVAADQAVRLTVAPEDVLILSDPDPESVGPTGESTP